MFAGIAAQERGASLHPVDWDPEDADLHAMARKKVAATVDGLGPAAAPLLIGKSLGTVAATVAADRSLPAVWFTPLLTEPEVVAALRRSSAPCLLIGGTDDDWWDGAVARSITPHVVEIAEAGHRMFVPGPLSRSAAALGEMSTGVERFLDEVVWPA